MADRQGAKNKERFPVRKNAQGRMLCRMCGDLTIGRQTFCSPRCLRDFFMRTDWSRVRRVIYERDGGICMKCGRKLGPRNFHVDHIMPVALGGDEWDLANLELACPECNLQKGTREEIEYVVL